MEGTTTPRRSREPEFQVGQVVRHRSEDLRGVIVDAHQRYKGSLEKKLAAAALGLDWRQPWYELLVHGTTDVAYLPEEAMVADLSMLPVSHPLLPMFFNSFRAGRHLLSGMAN